MSIGILEHYVGKDSLNTNKHHSNVHQFLVSISNAAMCKISVPPMHERLFQSATKLQMAVANAPIAATNYPRAPKTNTPPETGSYNRLSQR